MNDDMVYGLVTGILVCAALIFLILIIGGTFRDNGYKEGYDQAIYDCKIDNLEEK